jgi:hypothetical protein
MPIEIGLSFFFHTQRNVGLQEAIRRESGFPLLPECSPSGCLSVYHPANGLIERLFSLLQMLVRPSGYKYPGVYGSKERALFSWKEQLR